MAVYCDDEGYLEMDSQGNCHVLEGAIAKDIRATMSDEPHEIGLAGILIIFVILAFIVSIISPNTSKQTFSKEEEPKDRDEALASAQETIDLYSSLAKSKLLQEETIFQADASAVSDHDRIKRSIVKRLHLPEEMVEIIMKHLPLERYEELSKTGHDYLVFNEAVEKAGAELEEFMERDRNKDRKGPA